MGQDAMSASCNTNSGVLSCGRMRMQHAELQVSGHQAKSHLFSRCGRMVMSRSSRTENKAAECAEFTRARFYCRISTQRSLNYWRSVESALIDRLLQHRHTFGLGRSLQTTAV